MALRVLCAGCPKDEREGVEALVRKALGSATDEGAWSVSLVRLGSQWSVTLDAPAGRVRARTLMATGPGLAQALSEAVVGHEPAPAPAAPAQQTAPTDSPAPAAAAPEGRPTVSCEKCAQGFVVIYDSTPDEGLERVPVACPHCWSLNQVLVGAEAAANTDYRAEKA